MTAEARAGLAPVPLAAAATEPGPGLRPGSWSSPWFAPYRPLLDALADDLAAGRWSRCVERLNDLARDAGLLNDNGRPVRFVTADAAGGAAYEAHIWATGGVPTRTGEPGAWHDLFNALVWLTFPRTKARLNRLQAEVIAVDGVGTGRGALRDAATLFDENAALLLTRDRGLVESLRRFDWNALFVAGRARFAREARVVVFGHALLDKLRAPYKAACAHAWVVEAGEGDDVDALTAASLQAPTLDSVAFAPLPVLGVPGWWAASDDPRFYDDPRVFRAGRRTVQRR